MKISFQGFYTSLALMIIMVIFTISYPNFFTPDNLSNLFLQSTPIGVLAVGMTLVILTSGIDLSVGSIVAFSGMVIGISQVRWGWASGGVGQNLISIGLAILAGGFLGLLNGLLIAFSKIPPFIITLGMMQIARGLTQILLNSQTVSGFSDHIKLINSGALPVWLSAFFIVAALILMLKKFFKKSEIIPILFSVIFLGIIFFVFVFNFSICSSFFTLNGPHCDPGSFLSFHMAEKGIPYSVVIFGLAGFGMNFLLTKVPFGRYIYALGGNETASILSGISVQRVKLWTYVLMGFLAGLSGIILASRLAAADPNAGQNFELDAIASVVIGGTSLMGGRGSLSGTIVGVMIISTINNGMSLGRVDSVLQLVIKGIILIVAVWFDSRKKV